MRVVLDTNVLFAGLRSASGASFGLITALRGGRLRTAVTTTLLLEYEAVLSRSGALPELSRMEIRGFLDWFTSASDPAVVHFRWRPLLRDPADDMVLEAAFAAGVDFLVTFNTRDFAGVGSLGVRVITPGDLLTMLRNP